jgi:hypothetical protein
VTDEELLEARDKAWIEFLDYEHQDWLPRFYKKRSKGANRLINPFDTLEERIAASDRRRELWWKWLQLEFAVSDRSLARISSDLLSLWKMETTEDGDRYRRRHA